MYKMRNTGYFTVIMLLLNIFTGNVFPQWSSNSGVNLTVCDTIGEQCLPKSAPTSDGGCYISWFDSRQGMYALYIQKLDVNGYPQFSPKGLLVSNKPQQSSLLDWDMATDKDDNAILVFCDIRNSPQYNPVAYKVSPKGELLWTENGISLSDSVNINHYNPKVAVTSDDNYVFCWILSSDTRKVILQKLNAAGTKQWGAGVVISGSGDESIDWPWHIASNNGSVILMCSGYSGSFSATKNYKLYSKKISSTGSLVWDDTVYNLAYVPGYYTPRIFQDGNGGAIFAWQDSRDKDNITNSFVQHQNQEGRFLFPVNGTAVAASKNFLRFTPIAAFDATSQETYVFWYNRDLQQFTEGIYGQKLDSLGERKWGEDGISFKAMNGNGSAYLGAFVYKNTGYVVYNERIANTMTDVGKALAIKPDGKLVWQQGTIEAATSASAKIKMFGSMNKNGTIVLAWGDSRGSDGSGIYAQNINADGTLGSGNSVPVELVSFSSAINEKGVLLGWITATETNNSGFSVERKSANSEWQAIGFVNGAGTTSSSTMYSYLDPNPVPGKNLYRLKQMDYNGNFTYYGEIETIIANPGVFALYQNYPNPFNPSTEISFDLVASSKVELKVYDMLGQQVALLINGVLQAGTHSCNFKADNLSSGIYFYSILVKGVDGTHYTAVRKMILEK